MKIKYSILILSITIIAIISCVKPKYIAGSLATLEGFVIDSIYRDNVLILN